MKICAACNSQEVFDEKSDYCKDCEETIKESYEEEMKQEQEESFKANAESESGTTVYTYEEIFKLIEEKIIELVDDIKFSLEENLSITDIKEL